MLEEAWDKLELFEERKRTNLIFCGVRGEARETQAELINKVWLLCKVRSLDISISMPADHQHYPVLPEHEEERDGGERRPAHVRPQGGQLQV